MTRTLDACVKSEDVMDTRQAGRAIGILVAVLAASSVPAPAADPCDRACLEGHVDAVLAAMVAHDPGRLRLARDVRYTENGVELRLGDAAPASSIR
jgi:hypothetical protein